MRVISGKYKGKKLDGFDIDGTRPTMDRVKESLFGIIQMKVKNSIVLDLFAGSGSLGIEALSNGANTCYFVDNSSMTLKVLKNNLSNIDNSIILDKDYMEALIYFVKNNIKFDRIFLDPPYNLLLINSCIKYIQDNNLLNKQGIIICEYEKEIIKKLSYTIKKEKKYGTTNIMILENK